MDEHKPRQYQVQIKGGEIITIWMREKGRETKDGDEGVVFALLPLQIFASFCPA
jgi:hypothetical protein